MNLEYLKHLLHHIAAAHSLAFPIDEVAQFVLRAHLLPVALQHGLLNLTRNKRRRLVVSH